MVKIAWHEHFRNSVQQAEAPYAEDATGVSFLAFCLREKFLSTPEYLTWARETYERPVLLEEYLHVHAPQKDFYKKWQKIYAWNTGCLPMAEWDGVLIIACLEVPTDYQNANPTVFLLASYELLTQVWNVYTGTAEHTVLEGATRIEGKTSVDVLDLASLQEASEATPAEASAPSESFFGADGELILKDSDESSLKTPPETESAAEEPSSEGEKLDLGEDLGESLVETLGEESASGMPEGLLSVAPVSLAPLEEAAVSLSPLEEPPGDSLSSVLNAPTAPVQLQPTGTDEASSVEVALSAEDEAVVNIETTPEPISIEALVAKKGPRTSEPILGVSLAPLGAVIEEKTRIDKMVPVEDEVSDVAIAATMTKRTPPHNGPTLPPAPVQDHLTGELPVAPVKPTAMPGGTAAYLLEKVRKQAQPAFDNEAKASFQKLKTHFKKSMLLAIGDKDRLVKPILWDSSFEGKNIPNTEFNLRTPSIFKIVNSTQKPYHGFVTVNDLNEAFFETWNHGQVPDHVTIVPLLDGDLVVGMLMGFGEKSNYNKNVLNFTETVAKELAQRILKTSNSRAA